MAGGRGLPYDVTYPMMHVMLPTTLPLNRMTYRYLCKYYLPTTSFVGGKYEDVHTVPITGPGSREVEGAVPSGI